MNVEVENKRKVSTESDQNVGASARKIFKDAGEFFDQVSSNNIELAEAEEEIVIEKEIIRKKRRKIKQEKEEQTSTQTESEEKALICSAKHHSMFIAFPICLFFISKPQHRLKVMGRL